MNSLYAEGYRAGVCDEHGGIVEPEHGYPTDPLFLHGLEHGREDYRRRMASLMIPVTRGPEVDLPVVGFPRIIADAIDPIGGL